MKKIIALGLLLLFTKGYAADDDITQWSPVYISSEGTNQKVVQPRLIEYNYPGTGRRNCITDISASASNFPAAGWTFYVLDGNTTAYALNQTTMSIVESWYPKNPLCLSNGTTTYVYVSTGNFKLNVSGYEKSR